MRKIINLLFGFICLFLFNESFAQSTVTIGTGTATDYNFPLQPYFNYGWSSQIYTSSEIGSSGSITSLAFYVTNSSGSYTLDNQKIYMRQTTVSQHADKYYPGITGFTLVYSGSITVGSSGWKTIALNTPFTYSTASNLEILVESRDGSTFTSAVQTRYTSKSEYRTKYDYNDYSFPSTWYAGGRLTKLPNIQFVLNTCSTLAGNVSTSNATVCSGNTTTLTLSGQTSGQPIQWQESSDNTTFSDINGATSSNYTTGTLNTTKYFRAKVGSGSCIVYSNVQTISITALPSAPTAGNNGPVCVGSTLNLTASTIANASYSWTGPNGFTSSLQNPTVNSAATPLMAGTYSVTATINGCVSSASTTTVVTNEFPTNVQITPSATRINAGATVTLVASGATNYTWDNGLGTGNTKSVNPTISTTYTLIADNGTSCKDTTSITIDVIDTTQTGISTSTVTIGTGTASDYNVPLQTYFNYGWSSQLYLASELQGAGFLNSLSFYVTNSGSTYTLENQKIYLRHTSESSFADKNYPTPTGFTLVHDGPITIGNSGWLTVPFNSAFSYNGTDHIEVLVESRDGSTFTSAVQSRYTNQSGTSIYRTKYDYNNNEFPSSYNQGGRIHHYANIQFNKTVCNIQPGSVIINKPTVCSGDSIVINFQNFQKESSYQWLSSTDNLQFNVINNFSDTVYIIDSITNSIYLKVKTTSGMCQSFTNTLHLIVHEKPNLPLFTSDTIFCEGSILQLSTNNEEGLSYSWTGPNNFKSTTQNPLISQNATLNLEGYYGLSSIKNGCSSDTNYHFISIDFVRLNFISTIDENNQEEIINCFGASNYSFKQLNSTLFISNIGNKIRLSPPTTTQYIIKGENSMKCYSFDTIEVKGIKMKINTYIVQPSNNTKGQISLFPERGVSPFKYIWKDLTTLPTSNIDSKISEGSKRIGLEPGIYELTIKDSVGDSIHYSFLLGNYLEWNPSSTIQINNNNTAVSKSIDDGWENNLIFSTQQFSIDSKTIFSQKINTTSSKYRWGLNLINDTISRDSLDAIKFGYLIDNEILSIIINGKIIDNIRTVKTNDELSIQLKNQSIYFAMNGKEILTEYLPTSSKFIVIGNIFSKSQLINNLQYSSNENDSLPSILADYGNIFNGIKPSLEVNNLNGTQLSSIKWKYPNGTVSSEQKIIDLTPGLYVLEMKIPSYSILENDLTVKKIEQIIQKEVLIGENVDFKDGQGILLNEARTITKTDSKEGFDSGYTYIQEPISKEHPSWFSFELSNLENQEFIVGLSNETTKQDYLGFKLSSKIIDNKLVNNLQIFEGDTYTYSTTFMPTDNFSIERFNGNFNFYQNGNIVKSINDSYTQENLNASFRLRTPRSSIKNITTSFGSSSLLTKNIYAVLQKEIQGNYIETNKTNLNFRYDEEYENNSDLNYRIYELGVLKPLGSNSSENETPKYIGPKLTTKHGINFLTLNMCDFGDYKGMGILEITNQKNEKRYIRFLRKNSFMLDCGNENTTPNYGTYNNPFNSRNISVYYE